MNNVHETIDGIRLGYIEFFNIYLPYKKAPLELELCDGLKTHVIECNYLSDGAEQQFSDIIEASISTAVDRFKQEIQEVQEMVYENEIHRFLKTKVMIELLNEKKGENMVSIRIPFFLLITVYALSFLRNMKITGSI